MAKGNKGTAAPATAAANTAPAAQPAPTLYGLGKPYNPQPNTKNGTGGCAGTWALLVAHINANGPTAYSALRAIALANGDPQFVSYCISHGRLRAVASSNG